jgi:RNA-directed DNA polymerase
VSHLENLKSMASRKELAVLLGYTPASLTSIIYKTPNALKYTEFEIEKKSGGKRTIKAPIPKLKKLQSHLSHLLYQCLEEIEKERGAKPISFGFRKDRSIVENAKLHKRRRWVLNLDLENFFPSFNFGRVRGYFLKDKNFELNTEVATTIAQIACDGTALPQGSPCSPVISELITQILDMRLVRLAKEHGLKYSRYADDITFSTSQKEFPAAIAKVDGTNPAIWHLSERLIGKIVNSGFTINADKTRMHFRGSRQLVTGLVVNEKVNIRSEYYRKSRAMCDALFRTGEYFKSKLPAVAKGEELIPEMTSSLNPLEGILSYIYAVTQSEERRGFQNQREEPRAIRKLYRRFLFYKYFIALNAPLIVTEGKTDPIYLRNAVKSRSKYHPTLGGKSGKEFHHAVRYFNYEGSAHEILELGGGTGDLKSILIDYLKNLKPSKGTHKSFVHKPMKYPVIIVLDNDDGLKSIAGAVNNVFKVTINLESKADFYHITQNLFIVKTPEDGKKHTNIEKLFSKELLATKLNEKTFNPEKDFDLNTQYGKKIFAKSVVHPNAEKIDFSGFDPLLDRICKVIDHHSST